MIKTKGEINHDALKITSNEANPTLITERSDYMRKKKLAPNEELRQLEQELLEAGLHWVNIYENGCQDPFWPDGVNLNLVRNHCLYYQRQIRDLCEKYAMPLPDILPFPIPDKVDPNYMAPNGRYSDRLKRHEPVTEPMEPMQLSLEF